MAALDDLIREVRGWRSFHWQRRAFIESSAAAIREKALLDARAAVVGRVEPGFEFRSHPQR